LKCPVNHCLCDTLLDFQNKSFGFTIYKDPFGESQQNSLIQNHFHLIVQRALLLNFYPFWFAIFTYSLSLLSFCLICIFYSYASWIPPVSYCISALRVSLTWREILVFHFACFSSPPFLLKSLIFKSYEECCLALGFY
jgi:hypothetical protein